MTLFTSTLKAQPALRTNFDLKQVEVNGFGWHRIWPDIPTSDVWLTVNVTICGVMKDVKIGYAPCDEDVVDALFAYVFPEEA